MQKNQFLKEILLSHFKDELCKHLKIQKTFHFSLMQNKKCLPQKSDEIKTNIAIKH